VRFAIILILFASTCTIAQQSDSGNNLLFSHFTSQNGLSNDEATCVYEDKKGFIWIGTRNGLNFYTANRIVVYRNDHKDSASLPDNIINALAEDDSNHLWIATVQGLSKMNLSNRKIERIYRHDVSKDSLHSSFILLYDRQKRLWSADFGIDLFDPDCNCFKHYYNTNYTDEQDYKLANGITSLFQDSKNRIWAGTHKGIYQFDPALGKFNKVVVNFQDETGDKPNYSLNSVITEIFEDHQHQLWIGSWGNGLIRFFPEEKKMISFSVKLLHSSKISEFNIVSRISETKDQEGHYRFWVYSDQGFAEFTPEDKMIFYKHSSQDGRSPSIGAARQFYASRSGILWIAKEDEGIDILDPQRQIFKTYHFNNEFYSPAVQFGYVNSILNSSDTIWIATWYGNAVYMTDKNFAIRKKWQRFPSNSISEENNRCTDIFKDRHGNIWISTLNGLHRYNPHTSAIHSYYHDENDSTSLPSNRVVKYFEDSEGISWVFFYKRGFCKFNPATGKCYDYIQGVKNADGHTSNFSIWDLTEDAERNIWFADDTQGLWKYDRKTKTFKRVFEKELTDGHIATVTVDATNTVWIATRNGLGKIEKGKLQLLTHSDGLPTNTFFGARTDKQNRLWILSNQGMILYDEKRKIVKVFKEDDGLEKASVDGVILYRLADGRMVIGGNDYVTEFEPEKIALSSAKPAVYITDLKLFGQPYSWRETKEGKTVSLTYDQNQLSFDFAVLNYSNSQGNKFYYQLIGLDKEWRPSAQGFANYTNLDEGSYVFRVKGSNSDGTMNEEGDFVTIFISPPFWRTWWFTGISLIILSSLIYLLFRYRLQQALKLERIRTRISTDLHDDIGSTLSSISILSNMVLREKIDSSAHNMITEIKDNSYKLMERIDDIVWSINPENDTLTELLIRVKQFSSKLFEVKGIDYEFCIPEDISGVRLPAEYNQHVYLILKESINNMVKYSECTNARIAIFLSDATLIFKIADNGRGFQSTVIHSGNGIKSMKNRARLMKGELEIVSEVERGTVIQLTIKIK
jgi:ligand-binding sensor domain-containing protein